jgi:hypothetical protein
VTSETWQYLGRMGVNRVFAAAALVVMVALIAIGVATGDYRLILVAVVVGAVPALARRSRSTKQSGPANEGMHGDPLPSAQPEPTHPDRAAGADG